MTPTTTTTTAVNLSEGDTFHLAGRNGMGELSYTAQAVELVPRAVLVTTEERVWKLRRNAKVWVEVAA